jgi:hypothetical protein
MVKATSSIIQPRRSRTADGKAAVRKEVERLRPVVLDKLGLSTQGEWISQERLLQGARWAHAQRNELTAAFPSYAVSKLVRGDVRVIKDAVVFTRQFLKRACNGRLLVRNQDQKRQFSWSANSL